MLITTMPTATTPMPTTPMPTATAGTKKKTKPKVMEKKRQKTKKPNPKGAKTTKKTTMPKEKKKKEKTTKGNAKAGSGEGWCPGQRDAFRSGESRCSTFRSRPVLGRGYHDPPRLLRRARPCPNGSERSLACLDWSR